MKRDETVILVVALFAIYLALAGLRYRFLHPELTETQLFLHTFDAMLWK